jgi:hypothetical protein
VKTLLAALWVIDMIGLDRQAGGTLAMRSNSEALKRVLIAVQGTPM